MPYFPPAIDLTAPGPIGSVTPSTGAFTTLTANGATTVTGASFGLSGNISAAAWTTAGIRYANAAATLTDTTSSGTVATVYNDVWGGNTNAASSATTYTQAYGSYFKTPVVGTNVTFTNKSALGADTVSIGGAAQGTNAFVATGTVNFNAGNNTFSAGGQTVAQGGFLAGASSSTGTGSMGFYTETYQTGSTGKLAWTNGSVSSGAIDTRISRSAAGAITLDNNSTNTVTLTAGAANLLTLNGGLTAGNLTVGAAKVLQLGNAATTGLTAGVLAALTNATIVISDSTGQAYRVPCII